MALLTRLLRPFSGLTTQAALLWTLGTCFVLQVIFPRVLGGDMTMGLGLQPLEMGGVGRFELWAAGSQVPRGVLQNGEWWRLFTAIFLHGGIMHFALNCWFLVSLGGLVEQTYGRGRFLFAFLATGLVGSLASMLWLASRGEATLGSVGASGANCGILGLMLAYLHKSKDAASKHYARQLWFWSGGILLYGLMSGGKIDNAGHIGGFAAGFVLQSFLDTAYFEGMKSGARRHWPRYAAVVLALVTATALLIGGVGAPQRLATLDSGERLLRATSILAGAENDEQRQEILQRTLGALHETDTFKEEIAELKAATAAASSNPSATASWFAIKNKILERLSLIAPDLYFRR